jgi:phosphatidylserine decarboxylase
MIQEVGTLVRDSFLTLKGTKYTLETLLPGMETTRIENGQFAIIFLSPADCHRVFSPQQARLIEVAHVPGRRLLVHPPYQRDEFPVFATNERVVFRFDTFHGQCWLVLVAGWGVGNITYPIQLPLRPRRARITRHVLPAPLPISRGQWIATFELGSTAILILEPHSELVALVRRDEAVNYAQMLFSIPVEAEAAPGQFRQMD